MAVQQMMNQALGDTPVTTGNDQGTTAAPTGKDRVSTMQALKVVRFMQQSDFAGMWREGRDKLTTIGKFVGALGSNTVANFDLEPIGLEGTRNNEVVGQDVQTAQRNLAANQVNVVEVKDYNPKADRAGVSAIADFPLMLKPGDKVTLYQQDGKVQYYSMVPPVAAGTADTGTVARIDSDVQTLKVSMVEVAAMRVDLAAVKANSEQSATQLRGDLAGVKTQVSEVAGLKADLASVQKSAAEKDAQIEKLQGQLATLQAAQLDINSRFSPDKLAALEQTVQRLANANQHLILQPVQPVKPALAAGSKIKAKAKTTKPKGKSR